MYGKVPIIPAISASADFEVSIKGVQVLIAIPLKMPAMVFGKLEEFEIEYAGNPDVQLCIKLWPFKVELGWLSHIILPWVKPTIVQASEAAIKKLINNMIAGQQLQDLMKSGGQMQYGID